MYLLTNGKIITEESILEGYELLIEDNKIKAIEREGVISKEGKDVIMQMEGIFLQDLLIFIQIT